MTFTESWFDRQNDNGRVYDRFRHRIMFPFGISVAGLLVLAVVRWEMRRAPNTLTPQTPVFSKGQELYGLYEARKAVRNIDRLLVVEGYMDVVALAQMVFPMR